MQNVNRKTIVLALSTSLAGGALWSGLTLISATTDKATYDVATIYVALGTPWD